MSNNDRLNLGSFGKYELAVDARPAPCAIHAGRRAPLIAVVGAGEERLTFPPIPVIIAEIANISEEIIQTVLARYRQQMAEQLRQQAKSGAPVSVKASDTAGSAQSGGESAVAISSSVTILPGMDATLWVAAQGCLDEMNRNKWYGLVAERFDDISGAYNAARQSIKAKKLDKNLGWVVESLDSHVAELRRIGSDVIPRVVAAQHTTHPEMPEGLVAQCVGMAFDRYFQEIIQVVHLYAQAFRQEMDGLYTNLAALKVFLTSCFRLFETGDPTGCKQCIPALKTTMFKAGARFLLLAGDEGPATISGGKEFLKGPIGVNLGLVPFEELPFLFFDLPIYGHEEYHNIDFDIEGLVPERIRYIVEDLKAAAPQFHFQDEFVMVGEQPVPTLPFLIMCIVQQLPEIVADLLGGVQFCGPAYWKAMLQLFIALNSRKRGVLQTREGMLPGSIFELVPTPDGRGMMVRVETHTPDFPRGELLACGYQAIGFDKDASECRARTWQANGFCAPEFIEYTNAEQVNWKIRLRRSDFIQLFPVVVKSVLFRKMASLGGLSHADIVHWNEAREAKVQMLVQLLHQVYVTGKAEFPPDHGDIFPHYFGSALTHVYWELIQKGCRPMDIFARLNQPALQMMLEFAKRAELKAKAEKAKRRRKSSAGGDCRHDPACRQEPCTGCT